MGLIADVVDPSRRRPQLLGRLPVEGQGVEQVDVPRPLAVDEVDDLLLAGAQPVDGGHNR